MGALALKVSSSSCSHCRASASGCSGLCSPLGVCAFAASDSLQPHVPPADPTHRDAPGRGSVGLAKRCPRAGRARMHGTERHVASPGRAPRSHARAPWPARRDRQLMASSLLLIFFWAENSREFAFPENREENRGESACGALLQRARIGERAHAAPCCARCTPRAALTRRASHTDAPRPCAQHHSACDGPRRRAAHRVPTLKN
jgi:hypothetical protein